MTMLNNAKLTQYTLLSASFLATHFAEAHVIYTNPEPDVILDTFNSIYALDLNADDIPDFEFKNWYKHFTRTNPYYSEIKHEYDLYVQWVGPYSLSPNRIAGTTYSDMVYGLGVFVYYYPYALEKGDVISSELNFYPDWKNQRMAFKQYTADDDTPQLWDTGGFWAPGADEKFLAVFFADGENNMHYGWIRCSIIDTAAGVIIHDYAYEAEPETPIIAGALFGELQLAEVNEHSMYAFDKNLYVYLNTNSNFPLELIVYNVAGELVYKGQLFEQYNQLAFALPNGIYIAQLWENDAVVNTIKCYL